MVLLPLMVIVPTKEVILPIVIGRTIALLHRPSSVFLPTALLLVVLVCVVEVGALIRDVLHTRLQPLLQCFAYADLLERLMCRYRERFEVLSSGEILYLLGTMPRALFPYHHPMFFIPTNDPS